MLKKFYDRIKQKQATLLEKYRKEIEQYKKPSGLLAPILSIFRNDQDAARAKLAAENIKCLNDICSVIETILAKPAEERGFADNLPALEALAQKRELLEKNPDPALLGFLNICTFLLLNQEAKTNAIILGKKAVLEKDFPACEKFLDDKVEQYNDLNTKGILPCLVGTEDRKKISLLPGFITRINTAKNYLNRLVTGDKSGPGFANLEPATIPLGQKLSICADRAPFLLRGFTAVHYLQEQGGQLALDSDGCMIMSGSFVIPQYIGLSVSKKQLESSLQPTAIAAPASEAANLPVLPTEAAEPIITIDAEANSPKLALRP